MFQKFKGMAIKTFLYQIVMSFLGFMLFSALSANPFLKILAIIISISFYWYILFSQTSEIGQKISESDIAHKTNTPLWSGFIAAAVSFIPTAIMSIISIISLPSQNGIGYISFLLNKLLLQGMYIGIAQKIYPTDQQMSAIQNAASLDKQSYLFLIFIIPGILVCGSAFIYGYKKFSQKKKDKE